MKILFPITPNMVFILLLIGAIVVNSQINSIVRHLREKNPLAISLTTV